MRFRIFKISFISVVLSIIFLPCAKCMVKDYLRDGFRCPPESTRPIVYWYLMNGHVSKDGITKDLEAMSRVGIGEVFLGNIYLTRLKPGNVEIFSSEWMDCMKHAIKEASRLNMKISFFNSPGWSQSGGPWINPEESMRYLTFSDTVVESEGTINVELGKPASFFQDVAVLAFREDMDDFNRAYCRTEPHSVSELNLFDSAFDTKCVFSCKSGDTVSVDVGFDKEFDARSLTIKPTTFCFNGYCEVFVLKNNSFVPVKKHYIDRINKGRQLGPLLDAEISISLDDVRGKDFRICFYKVPANFELAEICFSEKNKLEDYNEKWLNKLPNTWRPGWNAYTWSNQDCDDHKGVLDENDVINVSAFMHDGCLQWNAPKGKWRIMRIGMTGTGTTNLPAPPAATGLEIDKLNRTFLQKHYDAYIGQILKGLTKEERKSFNRIIADSYETGPQNWTDNMQSAFIDKYGYDPIIYLPSLAGCVVGSVDKTNRFLWDMRRFIADRVAEEYIGGLRDICEKEGIRLWVENYGHWGFPSEFLKYGGMSHDIGGEFWTHGMNDFECRLAASACHTYGKRKVYAESFTSSGRHYERCPEELKRIGDWSYCEGVNHGVLHLYMHQPYENRYPGVNAWFGIELNRNNTWYNQSKAWIDYQRRCYFMLGEGCNVADVCFFVGEDVPKMAGWKDSGLSKGYNYDFINADVIMDSMFVDDGRLCLPNGVSYSLMVLSPLQNMRPQLLAKIKKLVEDGGCILGTPPLHSPSLAGYPECDRQVKELAYSMWGDNKNRHGDSEIIKLKKGLVMSGLPINEALNHIGVSEDLIIDKDSILWVHRKTSDEDIYFLSNQSGSTIDFSASFRVSCKIPEYWNAVTGEIRELSEYSNEKDRTLVPVRLHGGESCFMVFNKKSSKKDENLQVKNNFPDDIFVKDISDGWNMNFVNDWLGIDFSLENQRLYDWSKTADDRVKFYSGTVDYSTKFVLDEACDDLYLNFEDVKVMATVKLNGHDVGTIWCPPYRINISDFVKTGENVLEVSVSNLWVNQLIYQAQKKPEERSTWLLEENIDPKQPLMKSGLIGKSWISSCRYKE